MHKVKRIYHRLVIGCLAAVTVFWAGHTAQAAWTYSHRWNNRLFKISTVGAGSMAAAMSNAANDYSVNTVLDLNSSGGQIYGSEGIYGAIGYIGYTYPFNSLGSNCYVYPTIVPTGACNTTTSKATSATIYFNVSHGELTIPY